jgi:lipoprotein-anchoring transpeptidase ErfK/SrfK
VIAGIWRLLYVTATFLPMRTARPTKLLVATFAVLLLVGPNPASADIFGPRRPTTTVTKLISRQPPPKVNKSLEATINPGNSRVTISISKQRAYVFVGNDIYIDTPISSGKRAGMTPTGNFSVLEKDLDHRSSIYGDFVDGRGRVVRSGVSLKVDSAPSGTRYSGAPMRYFCRLTNGGVGMHIGILPGYPASHGCIRLPAEIAPLIYEKVKVGTPVVIES